jgi:hypothetical protein
LSDIGMSVDDTAALERIAAATMTAPHITHLAGPCLTAASIRDAMLAVDALALELTA